MLPFDSWDGSDCSNTIEQAKLEAFFGPTAVVFNSYQASITAILEVLGSRTHELPVILPITSSPDTISAVLRSGANPILLDINADSLQMEPALLTEVLETIKSAVIILDRPGGMPVDPALLAIAKTLPTIIDTRLPPHQGSTQDCVGTFTVFDFGPIVGSGSLVIHKFTHQVRELKMVRNGLLGLAASMNDALCALAHKRLKSQPKLQDRKTAQAQAVSLYRNFLEGKNHEIVFPECQERPYLMVVVENANKVVAHLHSLGLPVVKPVFPLHYLPIMQRRWQETPEYPVAESVFNRVVALPTHPGILGKEAEIIERLLEIDHEQERDSEEAKREDNH